MITNGHPNLVFI